MVGNVGSGKTTWIKKFMAEHKDEKWAVVSKDAYRFMLGGGRYVFDSETFEPLIEKWTKVAITKLLDTNINVIVDKTNTSLDTRTLLFQWIRNHVEEDVEHTAVVMPWIDKDEYASKI